LSFAFDASKGPVIVEASCSGPVGRFDLKLILDTGATNSLIRDAALAAVGYDPDASPARTIVTTGSGLVSVPIILLNRFSALGVHRLGFPVLCHTLPVGAGVDGLLGLDFLRGTEVPLDFRLGRIELR